MSSADKKYWGYLIKPDNSPTPLFEELLLGIANYIKKQIAPWEIRKLTPVKLAAFYKLVGGNYDSLFIDSPSQSIAFVYKSLGCFHSLEPDKDPFAAPSIPALTPQGYVRWQTVQLLLEPELHVPFLQEAVKRLGIKNPIDGETFPRTLPAEALPKRPEPSMCAWEEGVREKLRAEAEITTPRSARHVSRPSDVESLTDSQSSMDSHSIVDAADYFQPSPRRPHSHGNPVSPGGRQHFGNLNMDSSPQPASHTADRVRDDPTPTHRHPSSRSMPPPNPTHRGRMPSISTDTSFATTNSSRSPSLSPSPPRTASRHASHSQSPGRYAHAPARPAYDSHGRRHSAHGTYPIRGGEPVPPVPQQPVKNRETLSPHFFAPAGQQNSRPTSQTGAPLPPPQPQTQPQPPIPGYTVGSGPIPINPALPGNIPAQPGAFARGPMRASTGHAYRGDWRGRHDWQARHPGIAHVVVPNGPVMMPKGYVEPNGVRFADEQISPRSERMRRRTMEEMAKERERDEMDFEKSRRRDRRSSGETKTKGRGDKYL